VPRTPTVPPGPARLRASDADRERVAAVIRSHWQAGRLTDSELEERLGQALTARSLGDLRRLVGDLPAPAPTGRERAGRALVHLARSAAGSLPRLVRSAALLFVGLLVLGAIVGQRDEERSAPASGSAPATGVASSPPASRITRVRAGGTGVDDGVAFRVLGVHVASSIPRREGYEGRLTAGPGHVLLVAEVATTNRGERSADPFCGSNGSRIYARSGVGYDPVEQMYQLAGNERMCSGGLQPEERADFHLVYDVARRDARAARLDVWNASLGSPDILGATRVRFRVRTT
jgi:hypothetical protein